MHNLIHGYSECQEDELLVSYLINNSVKNHVFIDAGAHSIQYSNSYFFYKNLGWSGIAIEANPVLAEGLINSLPPQVKVVNKAVSTQSGTVDFFVSEDTYVSSMSQANAEVWGAPVKKITVESETLQSILDAENIPEDFGILSIDIEGTDLEVLESMINDSPYRPRYIICELSDIYRRSGNSLSFSEKLSEKYTLIGQTRPNLILKYID